MHIAKNQNKKSKFLNKFVFLFLVELNIGCDVNDEKCLYPIDMENLIDDGT